MSEQDPSDVEVDELEVEDEPEIDDIEAPEADAVEQQIPLVDGSPTAPRTGETPPEVDPADRLEQEREAGLPDEDEYR